MIKGLGHLIRTMFGGKRSASAQPSHMVGAVARDLAEVPLASDDVLRKAMEAASETALHTEGISGRTAQHLRMDTADDHSLPTLFLHGKVSAPADAPSTANPIIEPEAAVEVTPSASSAELNEFTPRLETLMTFQEIVDLPQRASEALLAMVEADEKSTIAELELYEEESQAAILETESSLEAEPTIVDETIILSWVPTPEVSEFIEVDEVQPEQVPVDDVPVEAEAASADLGETAPPKKRAPAKKKASSTTTPKRKKPGKDLPDDAVFLTDAVIWSQCGSWREFWLPPTDPDSSQRVQEFHAAAASGAMTVWGRIEEGQDYVAIAPAHWKKAGFDPLAFLAGRENAFSQAAPSKSKAKNPVAPVKYTALKVCRAEVETLFGAQGETVTTAVA